MLKLNHKRLKVWKKSLELVKEVYSYCFLSGRGEVWYNKSAQKSSNLNPLKYQ